MHSCRTSVLNIAVGRPRRTRGTILHVRYVIGIDAGGTKTLGFLADASGQVCGEARASGGNLKVHGAEGVAEVLGQVIGELARGFRERGAPIVHR